MKKLLLFLTLAIPTLVLPMKRTRDGKPVIDQTYNSMSVAAYQSCFHYRIEPIDALLDAIDIYHNATQLPEVQANQQIFRSANYLLLALENLRIETSDDKADYNPITFHLSSHNLAQKLAKAHGLGWYAITQTKPDQAELLTRSLTEIKSYFDQLEQSQSAAHTPATIVELDSDSDSNYSSSPVEVLSTQNSQGSFTDLESIATPRDRSPCDSPVLSLMESDDSTSDVLEETASESELSDDTRLLNSSRYNTNIFADPELEVSDDSLENSFDYRSNRNRPNVYVYAPSSSTSTSTVLLDDSDLQANSQTILVSRSQAESGSESFDVE